MDLIAEMQVEAETGCIVEVPPVVLSRRYGYLCSFPRPHETPARSKRMSPRESMDEIHAELKAAQREHLARAFR